MARNDKHLAIRLRKQGKSYNFILRELGVPKSTLSGWLANMPWSKIVKAKLVEKANKMSQKRMRRLVVVQKKRWLEWHEHHRKEAAQGFPELKNNDLFIAGLMLYWGEGDNKLSSPNVRLANTDPRMIKIFIDFAIKICKVEKEKIRLGLILYPDLNNKFCLNFWSNFTAIPVNQFHKTQYIKGSHPTKRLQYGICMVRIGGAGLKDKISTWIDLYAKSMLAGIAQW